jgi:hypothetical protein
VAAVAQPVEVAHERGRQDLELVEQAAHRHRACTVQQALYRIQPPGLAHPSVPVPTPMVIVAPRARGDNSGGCDG